MSAPPKRFAARRDARYADWIRRQPCALRRWDPAHRCAGGVQATHLQSRGAGGDDRRNLLPLCAESHHDQHTIGVRSWMRRYGLTRDQVNQEADYLTRQYEQSGIPGHPF